MTAKKQLIAAFINYHNTTLNSSDKFDKEKDYFSKKLGITELVEFIESLSRKSGDVLLGDFSSYLGFSWQLFRDSFIAFVTDVGCFIMYHDTQADEIRYVCNKNFYTYPQLTGMYIPQNSETVLITDIAQMQCIFAIPENYTKGHYQLKDSEFLINNIVYERRVMVVSDYSAIHMDKPIGLFTTDNNKGWRRERGPHGPTGMMIRPKVFDNNLGALSLSESTNTVKITHSGTNATQIEKRLTSLMEKEKRSLLLTNLGNAASNFHSCNNIWDINPDYTASVNLAIAISKFLEATAAFAEFAADKNNTIYTFIIQTATEKCEDGWKRLFLTR